MESFKHSCPFCSQHIEYTLGYCGKQIQCPMCGHTVTFPAVPPKQSGPALKLKGMRPKAAKNWSLKLPGFLGSLRDFQHWNTVAQCAVPFLILAVLLGGAAFVKNKLAEPSAEVATPAVQADPEAWQKMTELRKADQAVKDSMKGLATAHANADLAEQRRRQALARKLEPTDLRTVEDQAQLAQKQLVAARQRFDTANAKYQQLGGTVDYRSQCPKY